LTVLLSLGTPPRYRYPIPSGPRVPARSAPDRPSGPGLAARRRDFLATEVGASDPVLKFHPRVRGNACASPSGAVGPPGSAHEQAHRAMLSALVCADDTRTRCEIRDGSADPRFGDVTRGHPLPRSVDKLAVATPPTCPYSRRPDKETRGLSTLPEDLRRLPGRTRRVPASASSSRLERQDTTIGSSTIAGRTPGRLGPRRPAQPRVDRRWPRRGAGPTLPAITGYAFPQQYGGRAAPTWHGGDPEHLPQCLAGTRPAERSRDRGQHVGLLLMLSHGSPEQRQYWTTTSPRAAPRSRSASPTRARSDATFMETTATLDARTGSSP